MATDFDFDDVLARRAAPSRPALGRAAGAQVRQFGDLRRLEYVIGQLRAPD
jgi:hypothetical protein